MLQNNTFRGVYRDPENVGDKSTDLLNVTIRELTYIKSSILNLKNTRGELKMEEKTILNDSKDFQFIQIYAIEKL